MCCAAVCGELVSSPTQVKERQVVDTSTYLFSFLEHGKGWDVDAEHFGNEMRFINDYRGIAATPNAKFNVCTDPRTKTRGVQVVAISNISNGGDSLSGQ